MIYLDNAATSYPKPENVYREMERCLREYCANPGRGGHKLSIASGQAVMKVRESLSRFFGIQNPLQLAFAKNATEAINMALKGVLKAGDHIITSCMEHNSVLRPIKALERDFDIQVSILKGGLLGEFDLQELEKAIRNNTRMIAVTLSSNVNGMIMPVKEIGAIAEERGILFLVDASQGAGTLKVDVEEIKADLLAFPGHKGLLGPQGTGGLYVRETVKLSSFMQGGTGSNSENPYQPDFMPDLLESGTLNTPGIIGLGAGIDFINNFGINNMGNYKKMLLKRFYDGLKEIKKLEIYSPRNVEKNSGIIALNFSGLDSTEVSFILDREYGIATRAGLHCAPLAHERLGTLHCGIVRFSIGCFNTLEDIDCTLKALSNISTRVGEN